MTTVNEVLKILEENRNSFVSGNEISKKLYISRNAVWKAINVLRKQGYKIVSVTNKGYCLSSDNDIVSAQSIKKHLKYELDVTVIEETDSTNNYLKKLASDGAKEGVVIVAQRQTGGKGRRGKSFFSPDGTGVYFSVLLRPKTEIEKSILLTVMSAVAVAETAMEFTDRSVKIKWVNDVYIDGKKICGILTEGSVSIENNGFDYAVVGIGINVLTPKNGFPEEIRDVAEAIFPGNEVYGDVKSKIIAEVLNKFFDMYTGNGGDYIERYKKYSYILGKEINIIYPDSVEPAVALDITDNCHLIVKTERGEIKTLSSGDVSVRKK